MAEPAFSPRARLVVTLTLAFGIAAITSLTLLPLVVFLTAGVVLATGESRMVLRRLRGAALLALGVIIVLPLIAGDNVLVQIGQFALRQEGVQAGILIATRLLCIVSLTLALLASQSPLQLADALRGLGLPALIADLVLLTLRYLDETGAELRRAYLARRLRGGPSGWRALPDHAAMLATGLIRAQARSERIWAAMRLRGYHAGLAAQMPPLRSRDWAGIGGAVLVALGVVWLDRAF